MKKRLIFHFYLRHGWENFLTVQTHIKCLKYYAHIFDEALFVIGRDSKCTDEDIKNFQKLIIKIGFMNVRFKVTENTVLRESKTLKEEVFDKLEELDGITLFGHSKGVGNEMWGCDIESVTTWIMGLYWLNLTSMWEVEGYLGSIHTCTYGAFLNQDEAHLCEHKWIYSGTFFWINTQKLARYMKLNHIKIRQCYDRFFSEYVLGDILEFNPNEEFERKAMTFRQCYLMQANNFYEDIETYLKLMLSEYNYNAFDKFRKEIYEGENYCTNQ